MRLRRRYSTGTRSPGPHRPRNRCDHRGGIPSDVPAPECEDQHPNQSRKNEHCGENDGGPLAIPHLVEPLTLTHDP